MVRRPALSKGEGQPRRRRRFHRRSRLETLESRRLLAGDLQVAYAGIADDSISETNSGLVLALNTATQRVSPLANSFLTSDVGINGAAITNNGRLFVATGDSSSSPSSLIQIDLVTGMPIGTAQVLSDRILDLATDRTSGEVYALVDAGADQTLHRVDVDTGTTSFVGLLDAFMAGGLAVDDTGTVLVTAVDPISGDAVLHHVDAGDGSTTVTVPIGSDPQFSDHYAGLAFRGDGTLIGSDAESGVLFSIDPTSGAIAPLALQSPVHGVIGDLAFGADHCSVDQIYSEDFESGNHDFTIDNTGSTIPGLWHLSPGRRFDGKLNHSPIDSFYYGAFETAFGGGHYVLTESHRGTITTPAIQLPPSGTSILSFSYLLDTRPQLDVDFVSVSIVDGGTVTEILSRQDGSLPQTGRQKWLTATHDLSQFNGKEIQVQFLFDTGEIPRIDPEGWYVDDVRITNKAADADLSVVKSVDDATPNESQNVTFTIDVANQAASTSAATNVVVEDVLPAGVTFVDASPAASFDPLTRTVTWNTAAIEIGAQTSFTVTASVDVGTAGAMLENVVTVTADEPDPDLTNNTDTEEFIVNSVDLIAMKIVDDATPNEGQEVTFTIDVTNSQSSNSAATNVIVEDVLPVGVTFVGASPAATFDPNTRTVTWNVATIEIGGQASFAVTASVDVGTAGSILDNLVTATADEPDPDPTNNTDNEEFIVNSVDLIALKTVDAPTPSEGQQVTFTIDVTNSANSNAVATDVVVTDTLPAGVTFVEASPEGSFDPIAGVITWNVDSIAIGGVESFTVIAAIDAGTAGQILENVVVTEGSETDPDPTNNESRIPVDVQSLPTQSIQFITPLSVFRDGDFVIPADDQIAILGRVWNDVNDNGVWDDGESGIDGADIILTRGTELTRFSQSRAIDRNGDGLFDPVTERGIFWFQQRGDLTAGTYTVSIELPNGVDTSFPAASTEHMITLDAVNPSLLSDALDTVAPNFGLQTDFVASPPSGLATIIGHAWSDLDQDGQWDAEEPGRYGFEYFLDIDNNGQFDPETEISTITGEDGKYVFAGVTPGSYTILERNSRSTVSLQTFPDGSNHTVVVAAGEVVSGGFGQTQAPNIGVFEYGVFVRPADQLLSRIGSSLQQALIPWQSFNISNTTGASFQITEISEAAISGSAGDFVTTRQIAADGSLIEPTLPLSVEDGETVQFLSFYDPAIRDGNQVVTQSPDWLGQQTPVHTFDSQDRLNVITDTGLSFPVMLIGGSTFDSDISYDGTVDAEDFRLLDDRLLLETVITEGESPRFDPTADINARCPNGADQVTGTCVFPIGFVPNREIAFGDFGPLNVEFGSTRDPLPSPAPPDALIVVNVSPATSLASVLEVEAETNSTSPDAAASFEPLETCVAEPTPLSLGSWEVDDADEDEDDWKQQVDEMFQQMGHQF